MEKMISFNNATFQKIYKQGKSYGNKLLVLFYLKNGLDYNRLGISVSKKNGNSVIRHKIKRLIKEGYRINAKNFKTGYDIIFIARVGIESSSFFQIESAIKHLMRKNYLMKKGVK